MLYAEVLADFVGKLLTAVPHLSQARPDGGQALTEIQKLEVSASLMKGVMSAQESQGLTDQQWAAEYLPAYAAHFSTVFSQPTTGDVAIPGAGIGVGGGEQAAAEAPTEEAYILSAMQVKPGETATEVRYEVRPLDVPTHPTNPSPPVPVPVPVSPPPTPPPTSPPTSPPASPPASPPSSSRVTMQFDVYVVKVEIQLDAAHPTEKKLNAAPLTKQAAVQLADAEFEKATKLKPGSTPGLMSKESGFQKTKQILSSQKFKYQYYMGSDQVGGTPTGWNDCTRPRQKPCMRSCDSAPPPSLIPNEYAPDASVSLRAQMTRALGIG